MTPPRNAPRSNPSSVGGSAASAGESFQRNVAAWLATILLAEEDAGLPWDLPSTVRLTTLRCHAPTAVDDIVVETSEGGVAFLQAKRSLNLSASEHSDLASALDQIVRQFLDSRAATGSLPWERPLDPTRDRLVIATGPTSSNPIQRDVPTVLERMRRLPQGTDFASTAQSASEVDALTHVQKHVERSWRQHHGSGPSNDELRQVLSFTHIHVVDADAGGELERESKERLRRTVIADAAQADAAWNALAVECSKLAVERSVTGSLGLQAVLLSAGIVPNVQRSYRTDVDRLRLLSLEAAEVLRGLASMSFGTTRVKLDRPVVAAIRKAAEHESLLITGEPGAGKSGALSGLVETMLTGSRDVVVILADRYVAGSLGLLRLELGLDHDLIDVLRNWPGSKPAFLVVDALDAARAEPAARTLRQLMEAVRGVDGRWRVVASVRKYDLRTSGSLQQLFRGTAVPGFADAGFQSIAHAHVPLLSDEEIREVRRQSPALAGAIHSASADLQQLLHVPFNLRLLAEIVDVAGPEVDLRDIHTDIQLLDRYWSARVLREDQRGDAREVVLRRACDSMVANRRLTVERHLVVDPGATQDLPDLLSANVLSEWHPPGYRTPESQTLLFAHHALFDYAVARLIFRGRPEAMAERLEAEPDLVLMIQPSLRKHLQYLWNQAPDRKPFWQLCIDVANRSSVPETAKLLGPAVAASLIRTTTDIEPLVLALGSNDGATRSAAERCLGHVARALLAHENPRAVLLGNGSPWSEIVEYISATMSLETAYSLRPLLLEMSEEPGQ